MYTWKNGSRTYTMQDFADIFDIGTKAISSRLKKRGIIQMDDERWISAPEYQQYTMMLPSVDPRGLPRWGWNEDGKALIEKVLTTSGLNISQNYTLMEIQIDFLPGENGNVGDIHIAARPPPSFIG